MPPPKPDEPRTVAEIIADIERTKGLLPALKLTRDEAEREFRRAENRLANFRIELTRAVAGDLDVTTYEMTDAYRERARRERINNAA